MIIEKYQYIKSNDITKIKINYLELNGVLGHHYTL